MFLSVSAPSLICRNSDVLPVLVVRGSRFEVRGSWSLSCRRLEPRHVLDDGMTRLSVRGPARRPLHNDIILIFAFADIPRAREIQEERN